MNPCAGATRKTMTGLLAEFSSVFDDKRVHLGGDEMSYACWSQDAAVKPGCAFDTSSPPNETTYSQLEERFEKELHAELASHGKSPIHWHDPITERNIDYNRSTLIEVWDANPDVLAQVLQLGYPTVFAGSYYLDHMELYWEDSLYTADPGRFSQVLALTQEQQAGLKGVEACMWSESVDRTNVLQRVWPRAAAVAERGWSSSNTTLPHSGSENGGYKPGPEGDRARSPTPSAGHQMPAHVLQRLHTHRCRLLARGIDAEPAHMAQAVGFGGSSATSGGWGQGLCPQDRGQPKPE